MYRLADAWIRAHDDALLLVATDERIYFERLVERYGLWSPVDQPTDQPLAVGRREPPTTRWKDGAPPMKGRPMAGRIVSAGRGYRSANVIADTTIRAHTKGLDVLLDALLLSQTDFLLKGASAVAEFAIWVNLRARKWHALSKDAMWHTHARVRARAYACLSIHAMSMTMCMRMCMSM